MINRDNIEQHLKREIVDLDNQIYDLQTFYLENTRDSGNILKGFENYLNGKAPQNQMAKKPKIENSERLFSLSSSLSKTSEAIEEAGTDLKIDITQLNHKRIRSREMLNKMGKSYSPHHNSYNHDGEQEMSDSMMEQMHMDEDIINKFSNKQPKRKKIGKASKSLRNT